MNEKEKEALREMKADILRNLSSRIDEMLEEPEKADVKLGYWGDLSLWKTSNGLELRWVGAVAATNDHHLRLMYWLATILEARRPRVYREGDEVPERLLKWDGGTWVSSNKIFLEPGQTWCPLPPDYEEEA